MARGMTPDQVDGIEVWKLAAALGQGAIPTARDGYLPSGEIDVWADTDEARFELRRRRVMGEPIPPPPSTPLDVF